MGQCAALTVKNDILKAAHIITIKKNIISTVGASPNIILQQSSL